MAEESRTGDATERLIRATLFTPRRIYMKKGTRFFAGQRTTILMIRLENK